MAVVVAVEASHRPVAKPAALHHRRGEDMSLPELIGGGKWRNESQWMRDMERCSSKMEEL